MESDRINSIEITETDGVDIVFRPKKSSRNEAIINLIFFSLIGICFTCFMWFAAHPSQKLNAVLVIGVMFSLLIGLFIWEILVCNFSSITIQNGTVILQSVFSRKELKLSNITQARWKLISHGSLSLETSTEKGTFGLRNLTQEEQLWLIQYFRNHLPESIQHDWDLFCLRVALPLREPKQKVKRPPGPGEILVTRKRYDRILIPIILVATFLGGIAAWYINSPRFFIAPIPFLIIWLLLRYSVSKEGEVFPRISANTESIEVVKLLGWWLGLVVIVLVTYRLTILPEPQHTITGNCLLLFYMIFLFIKARLLIRSNHLKELKKAKEAVQKWNLAIDPQTED